MVHGQLLTLYGCHCRRTAHFELEQYAEAKNAFEDGEKAEADDDALRKRFKTWIRKCDVELEGELIKGLSRKDGLSSCYDV